MITHSYIDELAYEETFVSPDVLLLEQLDKLINHHFRERKNAAFYASKLCYGLRALNNLCRWHRGATVFALVQARVLLEVKHLAISTDMPVKHICFELGFNNMVYFCRFFKQREGMCLSDWRVVQVSKLNSKSY